MAILTLTDAYIRGRQRPEQGNVIDYDDVQKGLAVRFTSNGAPTFLFCYGSSVGGGSARRMVIDKWTPASGKSAASMLPKMRKLAGEYRSQVIAGRDPYAERIATEEAQKAERAERELARRREESELTVDQLCTLYLSEHCIHLRAATKRAAELRIDRYLRPAWGAMKAKDVTKADVISLLRPLRAAGKRAELQHVLALIGGIFAYAVENDELESITANPAEGLKKKWLTKADRVQPRDRALTTQREFRAFYLVTEPDIYKGEAKAMHADEAACCWRALKIDQTFSLKIDQGRKPRECSPAVDKCSEFWS